MIDHILNQDTDFHKKFISFLQKRNKRTDTKNVQLYRQLIKGKEHQMQSQLGMNAYNVLKKRLLDAYIEFLLVHETAILHSREIGNYKLMLLGRFLMKQGYSKEGSKILTRIKSEPNEDQLFIQLEALSTLIEYSHKNDSSNIDSIINEYNELQSKIEFQQRLNMAYAMIKSALRNSDVKNQPFGEIIRVGFERFKIELDKVFNYQTLSQLAEIAELYGEKNRAYHEVELFFDKQLDELRDSSLDNLTNSANHAKLLYTLANIELRKKNFSKSFGYLDQLKALIDRFPNQLSKVYKARFDLLYSLNLNFSGEAEKAENHLLSSNVTKEHIMYSSIQLTSMMYYVQRGAYKKALEINRSLSHRDSWYESRVGVEWLLNKKFLEVVIFIEMGYEDLIESRIRSLLKIYGKAIQESSNKQVKPFIKVVRRVLNHPEDLKNGKIQSMIDNLDLNKQPIEEVDLFFLSFYAWLRSKINGRTVHDNTMYLLAQMDQFNSKE